MNKVVGCAALAFSRLLHGIGMITQPDHLADKVDGSAFICHRLGHDVSGRHPVATLRMCRRCKRYVANQ
jgi:hypothetical protein